MEQENKIQPHKTCVSTIENATALPMTESIESIGAMIMEFRGQQVLLDADVAEWINPNFFVLLRPLTRINI